MPHRACSILSIAPYRFLPPHTGGQLCVAHMADSIGVICQNHVAGTSDNGPDESYSFQLHPLFPARPVRYLPLYRIGAMTAVARRYDVTHIWCEHPYMAPTAMALSRRLRIPWFIRSHNIEAERFRSLGKPWWRWLQWYERALMRQADGIFFITPEDCNWAIAHYGLRPDRCHLAPFGTMLQEPPAGREAAREGVARELGLDPSIPWLYFLGALDYPPNADAVRFIATEVAPRLARAGVRCHILIGGKGLPAEVAQLIAGTGGLVRSTGFIPQLDNFLKACDVMLNPVITGGGIKTKAVEALGYNKVVVSSVSGAAGIDAQLCGGNLLLATDGDWETFTQQCLAAMKREPQLPKAFYDYYYWGNIARHVVQTMTQTRRGKK